LLYRQKQRWRNCHKLYRAWSFSISSAITNSRFSYFRKEGCCWRPTCILVSNKLNSV
jgi:hypothetical protein